jgi:hypothetical protein
MLRKDDCPCFPREVEALNIGFILGRCDCAFKALSNFLLLILLRILFSSDPKATKRQLKNLFAYHSILWLWLIFVSALS